MILHNNLLSNYSNLFFVVCGNLLFSRVYLKLPHPPINSELQMKAIFKGQFWQDLILFSIYFFNFRFKKIKIEKIGLYCLTEFKKTQRTWQPCPLP